MFSAWHSPCFLCRLDSIQSASGKWRAQILHIILVYSLIVVFISSTAGRRSAHLVLNCMSDAFDWTHQHCKMLSGWWCQEVQNRATWYSQTQKVQQTFAVSNPLFDRSWHHPPLLTDSLRIGLHHQFEEIVDTHNDTGSSYHSQETDEC